MTYFLRRERDNAGDSGPMSMALWVELDTGQIMHEHNSRPRVGVAMRVGSHFGRSYTDQDWWQTTPITEILEESENRVRFKTGNSTYVWEDL